MPFFIAFFYIFCIFVSRLPTNASFPWNIKAKFLHAIEGFRTTFFIKNPNKTIVFEIFLVPSQRLLKIVRDLAQ